MTLLKDAIFNTCDTETTGVDSTKDRVVSIASVISKPTDSGPGIGDWLYKLVNPGIAIPPEAMAIHHITNKMVMDEPTLEEVIHEIYEPEFHCFVAHNAAFDFKFIDPRGIPVLCTMRLARKLWPDLEKTTNQYLRYKLDLNVDTEPYGAPHHALADAVVTSHLLAHELREALSRAKKPDETTVADLIAWVSKPMILHTCRFGAKHNGKLWEDVPKDYLQWMVKNVKDMDVDTEFTVRHYLGQ